MELEIKNDDDLILHIMVVIELMLRLFEMNLHGMTRKDLQTLCKKHGIPANLKNSEMATRLASVFEDSIMPPRREGKEEEDDDKIEKRREEKTDDFVYEEVEKQVAAVRAIRDVEIELMSTSLKLLRSKFTEEQLQTLVLEFFKENFPDLAISKNEESGEIELKWKNEDDNVDGIDMNDSILKRLSMGFPDLYTSSRPSLGGYDLPDNVSVSVLGTGDTQFEKFLFPGTYESQMLPSFDALRTPGQSSTRRQPKPGEMMLSVHGSPLGVCQEEEDNNNMGAVNEEENC